MVVTRWRCALVIHKFTTRSVIRCQPRDLCVRAPRRRRVSSHRRRRAISLFLPLLPSRSRSFAHSLSRSLFGPIYLSVLHAHARRCAPESHNTRVQQSPIDYYYCRRLAPIHTHTHTHNVLKRREYVHKTHWIIIEAGMLHEEGNIAIEEKSVFTTLNTKRFTAVELLGNRIPL